MTEIYIIYIYVDIYKEVTKISIEIELGENYVF